MATDKTLESLARTVQRMAEDNQVDSLQETYYHLRALFAQVLFEVKKVSDDHYAWLLMNHDANGCLDRLKAAFSRWQSDQANPSYWLAYQRELDDFRWIVEMAMNCKP